MALDFKSPDDVANDYLVHLKSLKPEVNTDQQDNDWWIRSRVVGGIVSGVYSDQEKISNDAFPQSARDEAIQRHLKLYFDEGYKDPTPSNGNILVNFAASGTFLPEGTSFVYTPNGNSYQTLADYTSTAITGSVPSRSVGTGQIQNLLAGAALVCSAPPTGVLPNAVVDDGDFRDGQDKETQDQAVQRILAFVRNPQAGGKVTDYQQYALDADPAVVSANIIRYPYGFGSVGVVITSGTTDIDKALDNGDPIVLLPSAALIQKVQDYIETQNPVTDCAHVIEPVEMPINVTVRVRYSYGNNGTILSGQTLTQEQLVQREIQRAIYKTPPGGRQLGGSGFVVASEMEEWVDYNLGKTDLVQGAKFQIILDRQVDNLTVTGFNRLLAGNEIPVPGTITVLEM